MSSTKNTGQVTSADEQRWVVRYRSYGGPEVCQFEQEPVPRPGRNEVLIATASVSINPVDWKLARGEMRFVTGFRPNRIPGCDFAGEVVECGDQVSRVSPGDRVFGMISPTSSGTYAEKIVVPASLVVKIPEGLSYPEAASLPLTSLTAFQSLFVHGRIAPGAHVLINGAAGGVGVSAVQLAKVGRARVIAVASSRNQSLCEELGADHFLDYQNRDPLSRIAEPYDLIFDTVDAFDRREALSSLATGGMLVTLNPGVKAFYSSIVSRRRSRKHVIEVVKPDGRQLARIAEHVASGRMRPVVEETIPIAEVARGWQRSMDGHVAGKLVLDTR